MDTNQIIEELTQQRDRVVTAISVLTGSRHISTGPSTTGHKRRKMSAEVKKRLSLAAKARWAKAKKAGKNAL